MRPRVRRITKRSLHHGLSPGTPFRFTVGGELVMKLWTVPDAFQAFTEEQWQAYQDICHDWPEPIDWNEARPQLEQAIREISAVEIAREAKGRSVEYGRALNGAERAAGRLQMWLRRINEMAPSDVNELPDVRAIRSKLKEIRAQYDRWTTPFAGRKNRARETFDNRLLSIWEKQFHGSIRYSKGTSPTPTGPLVRFLLHTYKIALGKYAPGPNGVKTIIEKAKKRKRGFSPKKSAKRTVRQR
jgi:hypothetical protein